MHVQLRLRLLLAALAFPLAMGSCSQAPQATPPSVVLITIDTLRSDYLGFMGFERESSPRLSALAENMVVCEGAVSTSSWTAPSTASLLTGVYPDRHRVTAGLIAQMRKGRVEEQTLRLQPIHSGLATMTELLAQAGYRTFGLASNPSIRDELGFTRGFERFECDPKASLEEFATTLESWQPELEEGAPYFLYLHLNDVHGPYQPREPWYEKKRDQRQDQRERYLSEITYVDHHLGQLFDRFGWAEDAIVVLVSDHGEEFFDHGGRDHGLSLYGELNRVLTMFRAPHEGFEPARVEAGTSLIDVLPTVLELAGLEAPRGLDGRSLAALGDPQRRPELVQALGGRTLLAHRRDMRGEEHLWAAMQGDWKLIQNEAGTRSELFDRASDPAEKDDRLEAEPERAAPLALEIRRLQTRARAQEDEAVVIEIDSELGEELRRLGYIGD